MQQLLMLVMIIFHSNVDILRQNMRLNAECRNYKYTRDHVNHLVDVRDIIIYPLIIPHKPSLNPVWPH